MPRWNCGTNPAGCLAHSADPPPSSSTRQCSRATLMSSPTVSLCPTSSSGRTIQWLRNSFSSAVHGSKPTWIAASLTLGLTATISVFSLRCRAHTTLSGRYTTTSSTRSKDYSSYTNNPSITTDSTSTCSSGRTFTLPNTTHHIYSPEAKPYWHLLETYALSTVFSLVVSECSNDCSNECNNEFSNECSNTVSEELSPFCTRGYATGVTRSFRLQMYLICKLWLSSTPEITVERFGLLANLCIWWRLVN